jgi:putative ABC transport system permease protein
VTLLAPEETRVERPVPATGGVRRWWRSWQVALRIARRDAWRDKWRSLLVVVLIFTPVAVLTTVDVYYRTTQVAEDGYYEALLRLGRTADARVLGAYDVPVVQSADGTSAEGATDSEEQLTPVEGTPRFPAGWHVVPVWYPPATVVGENKAWDVEAVVTDTRDPLAAGTFDVTAGHLPNGPGEVAVSQALADGAGAQVGSTLSLRGLAGLTVVGIADPTHEAGQRSVVLQPGQLPDRDVEQSWLVDTPRPLSWQDVRALNADGLVLASRAVLTDPPPACPPWVLCLDDGPQDDTGSSSSPINPADVMTGVLVAMLALLQVALLAGPAFAVSLRRRQRDLALVAANGGAASDLRRTILASAVVLGVVAGAGALVVAVVGVRLATPWLSRASSGVPLPDPVVRPEVVLLAAVAVVAALAAAYVPARIAARTDTLHALRSARPPGRVPRRVTWAGVGVVVLGSGLVLWGVIAEEAVSAAVGILALQLGIILLVPGLLALVARGGAHLPLPLRLATRDGDRNRLRTVSAVAAIAAAALASCVAMIATTTYSAGRADHYIPRAAPGTLLVTGPGGFLTGAAPALHAAVPDAAVAGAERPHVKGRELAVLLHAPDCPAEDTGTRCDTYDTGPHCITYDVSHPCPTGRGAYEEIVRADASWVAALTGDSDPAIARTLADGGAVVFDPAALGPKDTVQLGRYRHKTGKLEGPTAVVPGLLIHTAVEATRVVVGPTTALPGDWRWQTAGIAIAPGADTDPGATEAAVRAALDAAWPTDGSYGAEPQYEVYTERGFVDTDALLLSVAVVGGTGLIALIAALSVTALALADARPDLATMAAVGAPPRSRRRYAAATGLLVSGLGVLLGITVGFVPAWAITRTLAVAWGQTEPTWASDYFTVPWPALLLLGVGIPLITAAVAWAFTRSRVPLTRRAD